jgi:hypothetical protein
MSGSNSSSSNYAHPEVLVDTHGLRIIKGFQR